MSGRGQSVTVAEPIAADPVSCEEFGYGLGRPDGILVLRYRSATRLAFGENRQDFLHQLYWSPDGLLSARHDGRTTFIGPDEVFWAQRAVTHEVHAADRQTVYRICLREVPAALAGLRAGAAGIDAEAARLVLALADPGYDERDAPEARGRIMAGLGPRPTRPTTGRPAARRRGGGRDGAGTRPRRPHQPRRMGRTAARQRQDPATRLHPRVRHVVLAAGGPGCGCARRWRCWRPGRSARSPAASATPARPPSSPPSPGSTATRRAGPPR